MWAFLQGFVNALLLDTALAVALVGFALGCSAVSERRAIARARVAAEEMPVRMIIEMLGARTTVDPESFQRAFNLWRAAQSSRSSSMPSE